MTGDHAEGGRVGGSGTGGGRAGEPVMGPKSHRDPAADPSGGPALVEVRGLVKSFPVRAGVFRRQVGEIQAVAGVSFDVRAGETLGLVGESGSGKSTTGRTLLRLEEPSAGEVRFDGRDLGSLDRGALRELRREMQMIFQDPYASLNPRHSVGTLVREPLEIHGIGTPTERDRRVAELLERVGLAPSHARRFPHEFSGGQRQRIGIARALATSPRFIVADEPISALDVSIQAQIVNLLADLQEERGLAYLFIAHDLAMVRHISDRVAVMVLGRIVEIGPAEVIFQRPRHPYTRALLDAAPRIGGEADRKTAPLPDGELPDPAAPPSGCRYRTRCPLATAVCATEVPVLRASPGDEPPENPEGTQVACHHPLPSRNQNASPNLK